MIKCFSPVQWKTRQQGHLFGLLDTRAFKVALSEDLPARLDLIDSLAAQRRWRLDDDIDVQDWRNDVSVFESVYGNVSMDGGWLINSQLPGLCSWAAGFVDDDITLMSKKVTAGELARLYGSTCPGDRYLHEIQGQILVGDLESVNVCFWSPGPGVPPLQRVIKRDQEYIDRLLQRLIPLVEAIDAKAKCLPPRI